MMESQCEYRMYFPAAPISSLSDAAEFPSLPRRSHVYLGETVQFLLVLRSRTDGGSGVPPWKHLDGPLSALASVSVAESRQQRPGEFRSDLQSGCSGDGEEGEEGERQPETTDHRRGTPENERTFRRCAPLLNHRCSAGGHAQQGGGHTESTLVLDDQLIFCLTVALDKLPVSTLKAKIVVTVWKQEEEKAELKEHGYLTLLQLRSPIHTFRKDLSTFKTQVSTTMDVLPPPSVQCQQMTVSGTYLTVLKVLNCSSQEEMYVTDVKILPNQNSSYLPMMPDGSVLIVDNVSHQSAEVTTASFCRIGSRSSHLPSMLSALEEQNFLFQLQLQDKAEEDSSEGLELPLLAVLQWSTPALPLMRYISTCYSVPSIRLDRPRLVMTASCPSIVSPLEPFWVKYTLLNNLQDFLSVHLLWNSEVQDPSVGAVVCRTPLNSLGRCRKGSTLSFIVAFQVLRTGLFELSQHMKLQLQFTASVSGPPGEPRSPSSSSPAVREVLGRRGPGRSQSFSHRQPSRSHFRSGSVMEGGTITPPPGSVGRALLLLPSPDPTLLPSPDPTLLPSPDPTLLPSPDPTLLPVEKIAKRECNVLVLERLQEAHSRTKTDGSRWRKN